MKIVVTLALIAGALSFGQDKAAQENPSQERALRERKAPPQDAKPPAGAALPTIPAGAKEIEPGLFRYTDPQGKTWLMRRTPFGVGKWEDKPAEPVVEKSTVPVTITDLGDSYQFVRNTPFGPGKWTRKKTELTDEEKDMVKRDQAKRSGDSAQSGDGKQTEKPKEKQ